MIKVPLNLISLIYSIIALEEVLENGDEELLESVDTGTWLMASIALVCYLDLVSIWIFVWQYFRTSFIFGKIFTQVGIDFLRNGGHRPEVIVRGVTTSINETE